MALNNYHGVEHEGGMGRPPLGMDIIADRKNVYIKIVKGIPRVPGLLLYLQREGNSLGGLRHLSIVFLGNKAFSIIVKSRVSL